MVQIAKSEYDRLKQIEEKYTVLVERAEHLEGYVKRRRELTVLSQDRNKARQLGVSLEEYRKTKPTRGRPKKMEKSSDIAEKE